MHTLPANRNVPTETELWRMSSEEIVGACKRFSIKYSWMERGVRKYSMIKTLRTKLNDLREGKLTSNWYHRYSTEEMKKAPEPETTTSTTEAEPPSIGEDEVRSIVQDELTTLKSKFNEALKTLNAKIEITAPPKTVIIVDPKKDAEIKVEGQHEKFELLVRYVQARQNILMVGPAGSGKTWLAGHVAKVCGLRYGGISCSVGMSEGQLLGRVLPFGKGGQFVYVKSQFIEFYQNGGLFLFDELDAADANTMIVLNSALSNDFVNVPNDPDHPVVPRHKDFVCMAAANTYGTGGNRIYSGRNQLDAASLDRFLAARVDVDYDPKIERAFVDEEILEWGTKIRDAIKTYQLRKFVSTRVLARFTDQKRLGLTMEDFKRSFFLDWSDDDKRKVESAYKGITI